MAIPTLSTNIKGLVERCQFQKIKMALQVPSWTLLMAAFLCLLQLCSSQKKMCNQPANSTASIYDFTIRDVHRQQTINMSDFRGKVLVFVNVATYWGKTPQYYGLNALQAEFGSQGLQIFGVPCNQFNHVSNWFPW